GGNGEKLQSPVAGRSGTRSTAEPRSRRSSRTVVGTKGNAVAAAQRRVGSNRRGRLRASQQCLVGLPFARRIERLKKLHVAGGKQRNGEAVPVEQAVAR